MAHIRALLILLVLLLGGTTPTIRYVAAATAGGQALRFFDPVGVAVSRSGDVYVFQRGTSRIHKFSPQGQFLANWRVKIARTFPGPGRLTIDGAGNVSVLLGNSRQRNVYMGGIETFASTGRPLARWYSPALLNTQLLAAGSGGYLYAVAPVSLDGGARQSGRVLKLSSTGRVVASWQLSIAGYDFIAPAGIATDSHGNVYVSGSVGSCSRGCQGSEAEFIERFKPWGTMRSLLRFPPDTVAMGPGLVVDDRGNIFSGGGISVDEVSPNGRITGQWGGTAGCAPLRFRSIAGVALDTQKNLYVVDESNDNLQRLHLATQSVTIWGDCPATPPPAPGLPTPVQHEFIQLHGPA
jgi:tripartite motif-containing protein 71